MQGAVPSFEQGCIVLVVLAPLTWSPLFQTCIHQCGPAEMSLILTLAAAVALSHIAFAAEILRE